MIIFKSPFLIQVDQAGRGSDEARLHRRAGQKDWGGRAVIGAAGYILRHRATEFTEHQDGDAIRQLGSGQVILERFHSAVQFEEKLAVTLELGAMRIVARLKGVIDARAETHFEQVLLRLFRAWGVDGASLDLQPMSIPIR